MDTYAGWASRYLRTLGRPAEEAGEEEIGRFLSGLATAGHVSASTQNQALHSILFLYTQVLGKEIGMTAGVVRAKRSERLPIVLSRDEVRAILGMMSGAPRLMAALLYGAGLRLMECCRLRVKDLDWDQNQLVVLGAVELPNALSRKYPNAPKEWGWQWCALHVSHAFSPRQRTHSRYLQAAILKDSPVTA